MFIATSKHKTITLNINIPVNTRTKRITELSGYGNALVKVVNQNKRQFIRKGSNANNGSYQTDYFIIDNSGNLLSEIIWDFEETTHIYVYPIDDNILTITGGNFYRKVNNYYEKHIYYERGIILQRSNVVIEKISHSLVNEVQGMPYDGFIHGINVANITVRDCYLQSHITYNIPNTNTPMGSYDLRFDGIVNLKLDNIIDKNFNEDRWGIFTLNFAKDIVVEKSQLSRIDAHQGVWNIYVKNCILGHQSIKLIGGGNCTIEDLIIFNSPYIVELREDYGSSWNGNITIRNIKLKVKHGITYSPKIINFKNDGTHNFGYECFFPKNIIVENVEIDDTGVINNNNSYPTMTLFNTSKVTIGDINNPYPYVFGELYSFKNIKTLSGTGISIFGSNPQHMKSYKQYEYEELEVIMTNIKNLKIKSNMKIVLDNVQLTDFPSGATFSTSNIIRDFSGINGDNTFLTNKNRVLPTILFKNCKNVFATPQEYPCELILEDCEIRQLIGHNKTTHMIGAAKNCIFKPIQKSITRGVYPNLRNFVFEKCIFEKPIILDSENPSIVDYANCYAFLEKLKTVNGKYIKVPMKMINCELFKEFDFSQLDSRIANCNFEFNGIHDLEILPSAIGFDGEKPVGSEIKIPVGWKYWITTQNKFITWNGTNWLNDNGSIHE